MASLRCKTKGNTSAKRKNRVYFCCHPLDFNRFFPGISDEILNYANCGIWYREPDDPLDMEEHLSLLSEMQLFVIPITTRFLSTENLALQTEFRFAMEHHIPVLPLMQEKGLDALFNKICGDLQYLDKLSTDPTAIGYETKLSQFLSGVLIGDQLEQDIRNAFDAYLFLSYRKKDRKHAQELMRAIHQNDFCRDIAIWYDEFLTPGENFNDSIREALEKSQLFVLAVTPNLVNEENYVMTTEYPMAVSAGKPVLPAQMVETDRNLLEEKYKGIPPCTDATDSPALSKALLQAVEGLNIKENDTSARHNYLIGLAYLGGVDVEVDHKRALSLLEQSATGGYLPAVEKLSAMYQQGEGVARNFQLSAHWQKMAMALYSHLYWEDPCPENLEAWLVSHIEYAGKFIYMNQGEEAVAVYRSLIGNCNHLLNQIPEEDHISRRLCLRYMGDAYMNIAQFDPHSTGKEDSETLHKALSVLEPLYKQEYTREAVAINQSYARCLVFLGNRARIDNQLDLAVSYFEKANRINRALYQCYPEDWYAFNTALGFHNLGAIHVMNFDYEKAKSCYTQSISLLEEVMANGQKLLATPLLVESHIELSKVYRFLGETQPLLTLLEKANQLGESHYRDTGVYLYSPLMLANAFLAQAHCFLLKDFGSAQIYLKKALAINDKCIKKLGINVNPQTSLLVYIILHYMAFTEEDLPRAKLAAQKAVEYAEQCLAAKEKVVALDCAGAYGALANCEATDGNPEKALVLVNKALQILQDGGYQETDPMVFSVYFSLYSTKAVSSAALEKLKETVTACQRGIAMYYAIEETSPGLTAVSSPSVLHIYLSEALLETDPKGAKEYLLERLAFYETRLRTDPSVKNLDGAALTCHYLQSVCRVFDRKKYRQKTLDYIHQLETNFPEQVAETGIYMLLSDEEE